MLSEAHGAGRALHALGTTWPNGWRRRSRGGKVWPFGATHPRVIGRQRSCSRTAKPYRPRERLSNVWPVCPRGIEGASAPWASGEHVFQLVGGLRSGMGYLGCSNIPELQRKTRSSFVSPGAGCARATCTTSSSLARPPTTTSSNSK